MHYIRPICSRLLLAVLLSILLTFKPDNNILQKTHKNSISHFVFAQQFQQPSLDDQLQHHQLQQQYYLQQQHHQHPQEINLQTNHQELEHDQQVKSEYQLHERQPQIHPHVQQQNVQQIPNLPHQAQQKSQHIHHNPHQQQQIPQHQLYQHHEQQDLLFQQQQLQEAHHHHHQQQHLLYQQQQVQQQLPVPYEGTVKVIKGKIKDGKFTGDGYRSSYTIDPSQQIVHRHDQHIRIDGDDDEVTFVSRDSTLPLHSAYRDPALQIQSPYHPYMVDESSKHLTPQSCQAVSPLIESSFQHAVPHIRPHHAAVRPSQNSDIEAYPVSRQYNHHHEFSGYESSLMGAIRQYWHYVLGLCITSALFLNWLFMLLKRRWINMIRVAAERLVVGESITNQSSGTPLIKATSSSSSSSSTQNIDNIHNNNNIIQPAIKSLLKDTASSVAHDSAYDDTVSPLSSCDPEHSSLSSSSKTSSSSSASCQLQSSSNESLNLSATDSILCQQKHPSTPQQQHQLQSQQQQQASVGIRQRSSTLKAEPIPIPRSQRNKSNSAGSKPSSLSNSLNKSDSQFNSRYSSDFVSIRRLGRGGFGIVFEAKNTIDDCSYAIKRICLPFEEDARERVMREVRALAKLDHPGIVRYYNAWLEHPPEEWLKQHDENLGIVNGKKENNIYSTGGIYNDYKNEYSDCDSSDEDDGDYSRDSYSGDMDDELDNMLEPFGPFKKRMNGRRRSKKFLRNNSSSQSLDIVFEGSGSIRLMSAKNNDNDKMTKQQQELRKQLQKFDNMEDIDNDLQRKDAIDLHVIGNCSNSNKKHTKNNIEKNEGDNIYSDDGDDSEYIQFKPKQITASNNNMGPIYEISGDDISSLSHLSEPFSSTSDSENSDSSDSANDFNNKNDNEQIIRKRKTSATRGQQIITGNNKKPHQQQQLLSIEKEQQQARTDGGGDFFDKKSIKNSTTKMDNQRKNALAYQKELRLLNNISLVENAQPQQPEKAYLYIQMQLCHKETLKDWLMTNCESRDKIEIFDLFYQIADAVDYVHSQDLIHRDLKPSNIFFSQDRTTVKIGDFGLCRARTGSNVGAIGSSLDLQEHAGETEVMRGFESMHTEQVGTQLYMSPEQLNGLSYNQKVDIFAMGLILLELLTPFKTQMQRVSILFKARNNLYTDEFRTNHLKEYELVRSLLNRCPQKRPTAIEIKQHELLASAQLSQPVMERFNGHRRRTISSNSSTE